MSGRKSSETALMKTTVVVGITLVALLATACTDHEAEARKAKAEAEAKARAAAAQKEMQALPKAFQSRDFFKKNEPEKKPEPSTEQPKSKS